VDEQVFVTLGLGVDQRVEDVHMLSVLLDGDRSPAEVALDGLVVVAPTGAVQPAHPAWPTHPALKGVERLQCGRSVRHNRWPYTKQPSVHGQ
jgi:hypothetical protein